MELLLTVVGVSGLPVHKSLDGSKTVVLGRLPQSDGWLRTQALKHERDLQYGSSFGMAVWTLADSLELYVALKERRSFGKILVPLSEVQGAANRTLRKAYGLGDGAQGSLDLQLQLSGTLPVARIAVIGGGIAGAAAARFLSDRYTELGSKPNVTIFEQENNVGGRMGSISVGGETVDLGGTTVLNTGKGYFFELAKRFGLELQSTAESNIEWGVWNGEQVVFEKGRDANHFLMSLLEHYGPTAMTALHEAQTAVFSKYNELFECVARLNSYHTLPDLLTDGRLLQLTQLTLSEFLRNRGVSAQAVEDIIAPLVRRQFALAPNGINAFAGIGATLLDNSPMHSIKGGNAQLVQALLRNSGTAVVAGKRVASISRNLSTGIYTVVAKQGKDKKATVQQQFDAVSTCHL